MVELNKIGADIKFCGCSISNLIVENSISDIPDKVEKQFGMDIQVSNTEVDNTYYYKKLKLDVLVILKNEEEELSKINIELEGLFSAIKEKVDKETFENRVIINGASTLYGMARSKIETISACTFMNGKILIPLVNIYEYFKNKNDDENV